MQNSDVIVAGLGAMGSAALYHCARRGQRVLGLDQFSPPHALGSTHGKSRIIRQAYFEGAMYVPLVLRAYELWTELEKEYGKKLLTITGGLVLGPEKSAVLQGCCSSADKYDIPYQVLNAKEVRQRYPVFHPEDSFIGVLEEKAGFLHPEECVRAHLELAKKHGATVNLNEKIISWRAASAGDSVEVKTDRATYHAEKLILTSGPWTSSLLKELNLPLSVRRVVLYWFKPALDLAQFKPGRFPVYIWELSDSVNFYGLPLEDEGSAALKVALHTVHSECTPENIRRQVGDDEVEVMRTYLARYMSGVNGALADSATCMYTMTPDHHFIIDRHPKYAQIAIAAGFSGHGFKFASVVGEVLTDLVSLGKCKHDISGFAIARG